MNIESLGNSDYIQSLRPKQPQVDAGRRPQEQAVENGDRVSVGTSSKIRQALDQIPEIRPEVVERGRQLAADPSYPPREVVQKIAQLIKPFSEE
ncbi:hypothetical protein ASA1KI_08730 [Opitutales bacterium ASA1]|uniref:hypothetical protein n=1 Tax=Congregicoccus parvus TaxID=3081749 RepID=UPI002B2B37FB|nr:hypothetical protein ASA1KI_08730 [Opitutales bacterium ASA1]